MGKVSVAEIKELMTATGVGMMDCKKALVEADGDMEKAVTLLREKGLATQAKKSGRVAAAESVSKYCSDQCCDASENNVYRNGTAKEIGNDTSHK